MAMSTRLRAFCMVGSSSTWRPAEQLRRQVVAIALVEDQDGLAVRKLAPSTRPLSATLPAWSSALKIQPI